MPDSLRESEAPLSSLLLAQRREREEPPGSDELLNRSRPRPFAVLSKAQTDRIPTHTRRDYKRHRGEGQTPRGRSAAVGVCASAGHGTAPAAAVWAIPRKLSRVARSFEVGGHRFRDFSTGAPPLSTSAAPPRRATLRCERRPRCAPGARGRPTVDCVAGGPVVRWRTVRRVGEMCNRSVIGVRRCRRVRVAGRIGRGSGGGEPGLSSTAAPRPARRGCARASRACPDSRPRKSDSRFPCWG